MKEILLPEIETIGIYNSQIAVKNKTITKNRKLTMFEIEIPIEKGGISYIDSEQMPIAPGMVICAKPGQIRHTKLPFKCYYIHMILKDSKLYDILMEVPPFVRTNRFHVYQDIFIKLCKYFNTSLENDGLMIQSLILELIYTLSQESKKQPDINNKNDIIEKTIKYINENIASDLSLNTVAEYAAFSPIHFHNCFKLATGKTLREYVEEQRIKMAADLLITTDLTLSEIASKCGFSSQAYFSYVFKRKINLTPREYAKEVYKRYIT